ncbi:peptidoglycan bridge formation glycyltransferase FemA/FemB family protein [candidate division WWE3 bacterium]|nr:peptidoglycan bridge formation glycyltransferase FemA/FemB family protein [candidate division WWE3 bacterium]
MTFQTISDKDIWDNYFDSYRPSSMLQSWAWGEFHQNQHHRVFRIGEFDQDSLIGAAIIVEVRAKRGSYITCQGGPMIDWDDLGQRNRWMNYLAELAKTQRVDFVRLQVPLEHNQENIQSFFRHGYRLAPMYMPAEHTLLLDLTKSEDELLAGMRKQTRYYIRRAEKDGVVVHVSHETKDLKILYELYQETVKRQHFIPYSEKYFNDEVSAFAQDNQVEVFLGYDRDIVRSAAMIIYAGDTAYYHHGASKRMEHEESFASYLVQWQAIRRAKEKGMKLYDFWGVAPTDDGNHAKSGLTTFKRGFGGTRVHRLHTIDLPISWKYWPMWLYSKVERYKRGWV